MLLQPAEEDAGPLPCGFFVGALLRRDVEPQLRLEGEPMNRILAPIRWLARYPGWAFLILFLLGFSVRVGTLTLIPSDLIPPNPDWETGAVALALLERGEFADPYLIPTGATAHVPPIQVGFFALLYKVLGFSFAGGLARWILVMAAHAATLALLPWFSGKVGIAREIGVLGGLLGALIPHWPFELESFSALALVFLLLVFVGRWRKVARSGTETRNGEGRAAPSLIFGVVAGISFHLQPVLFPVVVGCLAFELWWRRDRIAVGRAFLVTLGIVLACVPWGWRNYRVLGEAYFIRSNLGLELYVGNHVGAHGDIDVSDARRSFLHPRTDLVEAEQVRSLGEAEYMRRKRQEALAWIASHPGRFVELTATRVAYFWGGPLHRSDGVPWTLLLTLLALLGAWRIFPVLSSHQRAALWIPLLAYPLIYYVVAYMPRYGHPVRWILFLLAGAALWGPRGSGGKRARPRFLEEPTEADSVAAR
jgi:hypothetical protein